MGERRGSPGRPQKWTAELPRSSLTVEPRTGQLATLSLSVLRADGGTRFLRFAGRLSFAAMIRVIFRTSTRAGLFTPLAFVEGVVPPHSRERRGPGGRTRRGRWPLRSRVQGPAPWTVALSQLPPLQAGPGPQRQSLGHTPSASRAPFSWGRGDRTLVELVTLPGGLHTRVLQAQTDGCLAQLPQRPHEGKGLWFGALHTCGALGSGSPCTEDGARAPTVPAGRSLHTLRGCQHRRGKHICVQL